VADRPRTRLVLASLAPFALASPAACTGRELPDDVPAAALATGIPEGAPGAVGASYEPPARAMTPAPPRPWGGMHPKMTPPPAPPPDPFGGEGEGDDGDGGGPPIPPPPMKAPKPKGVAL
jgi:hypothetical protein